MRVDCETHKRVYEGGLDNKQSSKVDELMTVCDRLEAGLAAGEETRGRLVEVVLHETLESDPSNGPGTPGGM